MSTDTLNIQRTSLFGAAHSHQWDTYQKRGSGTLYGQQAFFCTLQDEVHVPCSTLGDSRMKRLQTVWQAPVGCVCHSPAPTRLGVFH